MKASKHVVLIGADDVSRAFDARIGGGKLTFVATAEEAVQAARPFLASEQLLYPKLLTQNWFRSRFRRPPGRW